jgi:hypothetical protein
MDLRCAPRVFLAHPSDEIAQLTIDLRGRPARCRDFQRQKALNPERATEGWFPASPPGTNQADWAKSA